MGSFIKRRMLETLLILWGVTTLTFGLLHLAVDPAMVLLPEDVKPEEVERFRKVMGLSDPILVQYGRFVWKLVQGDLGHSFANKQPVAALIFDRFPATVELTLSTLFFGWIFGLCLGIIAAIKRYSLIDNMASLIIAIGQAAPIFWVGIMLIIWLSLTWRWFPVSGRGTWRHLVLPTVALGINYAVLIMRLTRSRMLEVLNQDYIRTARAKGMVEWVVLLKHGLKNAAIPVVVVIGTQFGRLLSGAVVTETVFAWPGMGRMSVNAIQQGDYPLVQGVVLIFSFIIVLSNLCADLAIGYLDPRIRYS